jgi:hypothetical protein
MKASKLIRTFTPWLIVAGAVWLMLFAKCDQPYQLLGMVFYAVGVFRVIDGGCSNNQN